MNTARPGRSISALTALGFAALSFPAAIAESVTDTALEPVFDDQPRLRDVQHPAWFKRSFLELREDIREAAANNKHGIIVYFGQDHCAYCEALMTVNFGSEKDIVEYTRRHFDVIAIDIWGSREVIDLTGRLSTENNYAVREKTNFTPSLLFYDTTGREALRLRGYYSPYRFRAALEYVVDGYYRVESFHDYLSRADPPPKFDMADMNEQPYFAAPPYAMDRTRITAQKPLVVFFEQRNCHACDILHTGPLDDSKTRKLLEKFDVVQLDMWSSTPVLTPAGTRVTARDWAHSLGLYYAPTLIFFDERGEEIIRVDSVVRLYRLRGVLEYVIERGYLQAPTYQRWRAMRAQSRRTD